MDYRAIVRTQSQIGVAAARNTAAHATRAAAAVRAVPEAAGNSPG